MTIRRSALVTGGTGFVGSRLIQRLLDEGWDVRVLSSGTAGRHRLRALENRIGWFDVRGDLAAATQGITHFFNLAVVYDRPEHDDALIDDVNVLLPLRVLDALRSAGGPVSCVLADSFFRKFAAEATRQPRYTRSKQRLADAVHRLPVRDDCRIALLQIEHVYGPEDALSKVFPRVAQQLLANAPRVALTNGEQRRDFVHVDDVVAAARQVAVGEWSGHVLVECGTGQSTAVRDVFRRLHEIAGSTSVLGFGDIDADQSIVESKASTAWLSEHGWVPRFPLEDGLRDFMRDMTARSQAPTIGAGTVS